jgi:DNA-binding response OmpR family regulator
VPPGGQGDHVTSVLVVDDDPVLCELVSYELEQWGFDVRKAGDAAEAWREVATAVPDLVLLDVVMPGDSGLDLLERWRANPVTAAMPVIMLSGKAREHDVERGFELGADDYVIKPFSPREVARRATAITSRRQSALAGPRVSPGREYARCHV